MPKRQRQIGPEFRRNGKRPLIRFVARPYYEDRSTQWSVVERVPMFSPDSQASAYYDEGLPQEVMVTLDGEEVAQALNDAFNEGRDFSTQR